MGCFGSVSCSYTATLNRISNYTPRFLSFVQNTSIPSNEVADPSFSLLGVTLDNFGMAYFNGGTISIDGQVCVFVP